MLCEIERDVPVTESLAIIESIYAREGFTAEFDTGMEYSSFPVHKCTVRDSDGRFIALSWGKGELAQARASALFEAWQHIQHCRGQQAMPRDGRLHLRKIGEVLKQPELRDEAMLDRLAKDHPECQLGCLQYYPVAGQ
ncbi:MAG: hypothetical protein J2P17_15765, partial [Mycobacterium sp.]|nr:hypothetical protein [Mycobacterium sp.]